MARTKRKHSKYRGRSSNRFYTRLPKKRASIKKRRSRRKGKQREQRQLRKNKSIKNSKKKSLKKSQKGGDILTAAGVGLALSSIGAIIYSGLRLLSRVNDTSIGKRIINSPLGIVPWLPKVETVNSSEFTKQYLQCVSIREFTKLVFRGKYAKSKTLISTLQEVYENNPNDKNREFRRHIAAYYQRLPQVQSDDASILRLNNSLLETSSNPHFIDLKGLLLPTAAFTSIVKGAVKIKEEDILNKKIAAQDVNIFRVIYGLDKVLGEEYEEDVNQILKDRNSEMIQKKDIMEKVQGYLELLFNAGENETVNTVLERDEFKKCVHRKLEECCIKPRGLIDFVSPDISYDSQKQCLTCPQQDCLLYVHDYYYKFLKQSYLNIPLHYKLFVLMVMEARACVLAKCISLEAIRQQDRNTKRIEDVIDRIYREDAGNV